MNITTSIPYALWEIAKKNNWSWSDLVCDGIAMRKNMKEGGGADIKEAEARIVKLSFLLQSKCEQIDKLEKELMSR